MSRLIDSDKLKKALSEMEDEYKATLNENYNDDPFSDGVLSALFTIFNTINNQPTAYNVDKVVSKMETEIEENQDASLSEYRAGLYKAIEIVKVGGLNASKENC